MCKLVRMIICVFVLVVMSLIIYAADNAKGQYRKFLELDKKEKLMFRVDRKVKEKEIIAIAERYKQIYTNYPNLKIADDALHREACIYEKAYRIFLKDNYRLKAIDLHKKLVSAYPKSIFADDSIYAIAVLEWEKREGEQALIYLKQLDELYPNSNIKVKAQALRIEINRESKKINKVNSNLAVINNIRHWTGKKYTRVVVDIDRKTDYKYGTLPEPDRLFIDVSSAVLTQELIKQKIEVKEGFLQGIRTGQFTYNTSRVVLDFDKIKRFDIFSLDNPFRIVVDIYADEGNVKEKTASNDNVVRAEPMDAGVSEKYIPEPKKNSDGGYSLVRQLGLGVKKIVIDPGHGGKDPGAIGVNGIKEKDITLMIAKQLEALLKQDGFVVYLTRDKDIYLSLEERTAIANSLEADLFISIHVNSSKNRRLRGIETYYLNFAVTESEMEVAARENATSEKSVGELQKLIRKIMLNSKIKESMDFADTVHNNLVQQVKKNHDTINLGVKKAPFYVLIGAQMPAILVEVSFLSNPVDAKKLSDRDFMVALAEGIKGGIIKYGETLNGALNISSLE